MQPCAEQLQCGLFQAQPQFEGLLAIAGPGKFLRAVLCLQSRLDELESELMQVNANSERLQKSHSELLELQLVLEQAGTFFTDAQSRASSSNIRSGGNADGTHCLHCCWSSSILQTVECCNPHARSFSYI